MWQVRKHHKQSDNAQEHLVMIFSKDKSYLMGRWNLKYLNLKKDWNLSLLPMGKRQISQILETANCR